MRYTGDKLLKSVTVWLGWVELSWVELGWAGLGRVGLVGFIVLNCYAGPKLVL